jgi:threonine/homoserine/homoserine lactone efflux protein
LGSGIPGLPWPFSCQTVGVELGTWLLYFLAAVGLSLTPGPNGLLALTHGAIYGSRKTLATIFGGVIGFGVVVALSMFGIGALLAASAELLIVLKWLGGAYLVFLGIQVWRSPAIGVSESNSNRSARTAQLFRAGFLSAVTNPKGILFFVAFLPQFIDPTANLFVQFLILAGTFMVVEFIYELTVASLADKIKPLLVKSGSKFNKAFGSVFIGLGIALPLRG